jgi:hypothetical protein
MRDFILRGMNVKRYALAMVMVVLLAAGYSQNSQAVPTLCANATTYQDLINFSTGGSGGFTGCTIDDKLFDGFNESGDITASSITILSIFNTPQAEGFAFQFALNATGTPGCSTTPLPAGCITDFALTYTVTCNGQEFLCITSNHLEIAGFSASNGGEATVGELYTRDGAGPFTLNVATNGNLTDFDDFAGVHQIILSKDINASCQAQTTDCRVSLSIINNFVDQQVPEPASLLLMATGLVGLGWFRRRRGNQA